MNNFYVNSYNFDFDDLLYIYNDVIKHYLFMRNNLYRKCYYRDGRSRAGVYCAANACIEQVIQHGEVDVFQAVKTVRRHRPQLVENMVRKCVFITVHQKILIKFLNINLLHPICKIFIFSIS